MKNLCHHLNILFSQVQPEYLFHRIIRGNKGKLGVASRQEPDFLSGSHVGEGVYLHYAHSVLPGLNPDEVRNMYLDMTEHIGDRAADCGGKNIFSLLPEYASHVLEEKNGFPFCRMEEVLNWRECCFRLGQDLLVTSYLAYGRVNQGVTVRSFCWPAQIHTDDARLDHLLKKGVAENHFHLNGSARIFDISWLCLMNHPDRIREYLGEKIGKRNRTEEENNVRFRENLSEGTMLGTQDNQWSWERRFYTAAWLRAILFQWLQNGPEWIESEFTNKRDSVFCETFQTPGLLFTLKKCVEEKVQTIRFLYFPEASFQLGKGKPVCMDYAVALDRIKEDRDSSYRVLSGERAFLYTAFTWIFSGKIRNEWQALDFMNLFYLYLLLKAQFRNEIIQLNGRIGFRNFASYENRKDVLFETYPEYRVEAYNTSVVTAVREDHVISHELRIAPKDNPERMMKTIWELDRNIGILLGEEEFSRKDGPDRQPECLKKKKLDAGYFFTLHFVKQVDKFPEPEKWFALAGPRNHEVRERTRNQAMALAKAMEKYNYLCARVRGIDACNFEIGCRPETFATEFRFLREFVPGYRSCAILQKDILVPRLSVTYHAGEDFLDLADGMRAVDEAVLFLEMRRGERLGHAVALGISPETYYRKKSWQLVMPKQVRLDDVVWLLYRSRELGVAVDSVLFQKMEDEAYHLLYDIFGSTVLEHVDLRDYYDSWLIRGDDPELYRFGRYKGLGALEKRYGDLQVGLKFQYESHKILRRSRRGDLNLYRKNPKVSMLYSAYQYDYEVKKKGGKMTTVEIEPSYISLMWKIQEKLQKEIASKGVAIECNPSSNVLIAPIDSYSEHPVFRFSPIRKTGDDVSNLYVSVNTDDQGIFDTSLANEYALLACAMSQRCRKDGNRMYSDDEIYEYLDKLRINGITQTFPKAEI